MAVDPSVNNPIARNSMLVEVSVALMEAENVVEKHLVEKLMLEVDIVPPMEEESDVVLQNARKTIKAAANVVHMEVDHVVGSKDAIKYLVVRTGHVLIMAVIQFAKSRGVVEWRKMNRRFVVCTATMLKLLQY